MASVADWITIPTSDGPMEAYQVVPASLNDGQPPAVLVFMEIFGINRHIRDVAERLADEGYVALAINYYHRSTKNLELDYSDASFQEGRKHKASTTHWGLRTDIHSALEYLMTLPFVRQNGVGCIGFCYGGYVAYLAATMFPQLVAIASFYGAGAGLLENPEAPVHFTSAIQGEVLCLFGEQDPLIPKAQVDAIETTLKAHHIRHQVIRYSQAGHGFFCNERPDYQADAAVDAWSRVERLFNLTLIQ